MASWAPDVGIIVRNNIPHPAIRRIYYAQVWRQAYDVLCVRDRSFEICSIDQDARLKSVASHHPQNGIIETSLILPTPYNASIKASLLPPQIIVLVVTTLTQLQLSHRHLTFVFPYQDQDSKGSVQFATYRCPLPNKGHDTTVIKMAVDPRGRVLALTNQSDQILLYRLASWKDIHSQVEQSHQAGDIDFQPIEEHRQIFTLNREYIRFIDFVPCPEADNQMAYLIMVTGSSGKECLSMCKINYTKSLWRQELDLFYLPGTVEAFGTLQFVAPLRNSSGLILGSKDKLAVLTNIGGPKPHYLNLTNSVNGMRILAGPIRSKMLLEKVIQSCDVAMDRHIGVQEELEEISFVLLENGQIMMLILGEAPDSSKTYEFLPWCSTDWNVDMDGAFAVVDFPGESWGFITGGSFNNGEIVVGDLTGAPTHDTFTIANPDPVIDVITVPFPNRPFNKQRRLFATTNRGSKHGAISEIRHGYAIRKLEDINQEVASKAMISKIWVLPYSGQIFLMTVTTTGAIHQLYQFNDNSPDLEESQAFAQPLYWSLVDHNSNHALFEMFEDEEATIAFAYVKNGYFLRATSSRIEEISADLASVNKLAIADLYDGKITQAFIDSYSSTVLLVIYRSGIWTLCYLPSHGNQTTLPGHKDQEDLASIDLEDEPSCIYMNYGESFSIATVSMHNSMLLIFALGPRSVVCLGSFSSAAPDSACESLLLMTKTDGGKSLLCGFRSGLLMSWDLIIGESECTSIERSSVRIGSTSVQLVPKYRNASDTNTTNLAIVLCEDMLYLFTDDGLEFSESNLKQLWCTDRIGRGLRQPTILSMETFPAWLSYAPLGPEDIFWVTKDVIWRNRVDIDDDPQYIPWRIEVGGSPNRVIWSDHHKRLIVGLTLELQVPTQSHKSTENKPSFYSAIAVIDPSQDDGKQVKLEQGNSGTDLTYIKSRYAVILDKSKERITSLAEWKVTLEGETYHMLLVGIRYSTSTGGKVNLYNFKAPNQSLEPKASWSDHARGSVNGIAVYNTQSFIAMTSDSSLIQVSLATRAGSYHFHETAMAKMYSPGASHIRVDGNRILIGTQDHGFMIYKLRGQEFELLASDTAGGNCRDFTTLSGSWDPHTTAGDEIVLQVHHRTTPNGSASQISGLFRAVSPGPLTPLFRHTLPAYITRLQQASLRTPLPSNEYLPYPRVLASTIDGAWYSIDLVNFKIWRILKYLQYMLLLHQQRIVKDVCPLELLQEPPPTSRLEDRAIEGDLLRRVLRVRDPEALVSELLRVGGHHQIYVWLREVIPHKESTEIASLAKLLVALLRAVLDAP